MNNVPHGLPKRTAVTVRLQVETDDRVEVACAALGWKKQHFFEVAVNDLLVKLAGRPRRPRTR